MAQPDKQELSPTPQLPEEFVVLNRDATEYKRQVSQIYTSNPGWKFGKQYVSALTREMLPLAVAEMERDSSNRAYIVDRMQRATRGILGATASRIWTPQNNFGREAFAGYGQSLGIHINDDQLRTIANAGTVDFQYGALASIHRLDALQRYTNILLPGDLEQLFIDFMNSTAPMLNQTLIHHFNALQRTSP